MLREWSKTTDAEVAERRARLARTEERIGNLVASIAAAAVADQRIHT